MYWQGETDAQCSPFRDAASSLLASGEGWKRELIGSSTPTSTLDASHSRLAGGPEFESRLRRDFLRVDQTSDLKIGTPVATLPGT